MLLRHSALYLGGRLVPAAIGFLAIAVYSRLTSPAEFGAYALIFGSVILAKDSLFQWLGLSLNRLWPGAAEHPGALLRALLGWYGALLAVAGGLWLLLLGLWPEASALRALLPYGLAFFITLTWSELNLELIRAQLAPLRYNALLMLRASVTLALGATLAGRGWGAEGLLLGAVTGALVSSLPFVRWSWRGWRQTSGAGMGHEVARYGLPMCGAGLLGASLNYADRLLLGWLLGAAAVGYYAASYDLTRQSLLVLMESLNLAAFPLAVRAMERGGVAEAQQQMRENFTYLLALAAPATLGLGLLAVPLGQVLLGEEFRAAAAFLIPLVAVATLLRGLRTYAFEQAFQLSRQTALQFQTTLLGALVSVAGALFLIPRFGLPGAAVAATLGYAAALAASIGLGRRCFAFPMPWREIGKILLGCAVMGAVVTGLKGQAGMLGLAVQIGAGALAYAAVAWLSNLAGLRQLGQRATA